MKTRAENRKFINPDDEFKKSLKLLSSDSYMYCNE